MYPQLLKGLINKNQINYLILFVTSKCNAKCKICFYWKQLNKQKNELSLNEIKKISKNLNNLIYLAITGGEPFLRNDLLEICKTFYLNSNTKFIAISTNAHFYDEITKFAKDLLPECPKLKLRIDISLDAIGKKNDEVRGLKNNFKNAMKTYENLKKLNNKNLSIIIQTTMSSFNQDNIEKIHDYFKKLDINQHRIGLIRDGSKIPNAINVSLEKFENIIKKIKKENFKNFNSKIFKVINELNEEINIKTLKEKRMILPCVAGRKILVISEEGNVYPCEILNKNFGNLRNFNYDLNKMLNSKNGKEIIEFIKKTKCHCSWGCATQNNIIFNFKTYPKLLYRTLLK